MASRRWLGRLWRRIRRPTLGQLVLASVVLHLAGSVAMVWLGGASWTRPAPPPEPLIVELPPAEPGPPLVRPEAPSPPIAPPAPAPQAPAPRRAAPAPPRPSPTPPPPRTPEASPPPQIARPAEPPVPPPEPRATAPTPTPAAPPPPSEPATPLAPPEPPAPAPSTVSPPAPPPPAVAVKPPGPPVPGEAGSPRSPTPAPGGEARRELPFGGQQFSLLRPKIEAPPLPSPSLPGGGGTGRDGEGSGEVGRDRDGQAPIPLNTPDPRFADYFQQIKKRLEASWVYPTEAARRGQSGQLVAEIVVRKDGSVPLVELVQSSGVEILDRYALNAVRFASPFPAIPDRLGLDKIPITITFTYVLDHGVRIFGLR